MDDTIGWEMETRSAMLPVAGEEKSGFVGLNDFNTSTHLAASASFLQRRY